MNKVIRMVGVLAVASTFVVAGCGQKEQAASNDSAATPAPAQAAMVDTAAAKTADAQTTGVAECDSYLAALDKYMQCDKIPQAARDAQKQGAQQMRNSWSTWSSLPEEARKAAQDAAKTSCTTALNTLKQAATASGCPIE